MLAALPVLEPNLDLSGAQSGDLSRKPLSVCCVWVRLLRKLAHQKPSLLVRESTQGIISLGSLHRYA
jgi:hypothetical protein